MVRNGWSASRAGSALTRYFSPMKTTRPAMPPEGASHIEVSGQCAATRHSLGATEAAARPRLPHVAVPRAALADAQRNPMALDHSVKTAERARIAAPSPAPRRRGARSRRLVRTPIPPV